MTDRQPPSFPKLSESADDAASQAQPGGSIFSRPDPAPDQMTAPGALAQVTPTSAAASMTMSSRWRWAVVGVATVLVVGLLGTVFVLAQPRSGTPSTVARYAPAGAAMYIELRQDLPGDQRNQLAAFMSHFPGFADQAAFDQKLDEALESMLAADAAGVSWKEDVKPWFGGQVGLFSTTISPTPGTPPSMTAALTVKDRAALDRWLTPLLGADWRQSSYQDQQIWTGSWPDSRELISVAPTDEVLLVGTRVEDVQDALDVRADRTTGLADDQFFLQQLAALHADRLATFYLDGRGMADTLRAQLGAQMPDVSALGWLFDAAAVRVMGEMRADGDHMTITTRAHRPSSSDMPPLAPNRTTNLAEMAPRDAMAYAEMRDVGRSIGFAIERLLEPATSASGSPIDLSGIEQLLGTPPQDFFDFVTDASLSVTQSNGKLDFGLAANVDDNAIAQTRVGKLLALLRTLTQFGGGVSFDEQQHGGATITLITIRSPMGELSDLSLAISVANGRLLIGTADFVTGALDRTRDQSLAARPEYQAALQNGGTANAGVMFLDIGAARAALEEMVPADMRGEYELEQRPFLEPMSHLAVIITNDNGVYVNNAFLYVK